MTELQNQLPDPRDLDQQLLRNIDLQLANITGDERYDAFGRLRVSENFSLGDFKQIHPEHNSLIFIDVLAGNGAITHKPNEALSEISTGGTVSGDSAIRQTKKHFRYQPGKSFSYQFTGILGPSITNARTRLGFFTTDNGLYFEQSEGLKVVRRSKTSGSVVNDEVDQEDWNGDKLDGSGPSGITLDPTKTQIFAADYSWLGVGPARMCIKIGVRIITVHTFTGTNALTTVFIGSPNLPFRAEAENTGIAGSIAVLKQICYAISAEGGSETAGVPRHIGQGVVLTTIDTDLEPIVSIRLKAAASRASVSDVLVNVFNTGNKNFHWVLSLNPIITAGTAASWTDVSADSILQIDTARDGTIAVGNEGHILAGGYGTGSDGITEPVLLQSSDIVLATSNLAATVLDELVVSAQVFAASDSFVASVDLRELT